MNEKLTSVHMCKLLPELLVDTARHWFDSLPVGSIDSWEKLVEVFNRRFFQKAKPKLAIAHLMNVKQNEGEPISDFLTRFEKEILKVEGTNDQIIVSAFHNSLRSGPLYREILKLNPKTQSELWRIANEFALADDADRRKRELEKGRPADNKQNKQGAPNQPRRSVHERINRGPIESRLGPRQSIESRLGPRQNQEQNQLTPLNKTRTEIYELNEDLFDRPPPLNRPADQRSRNRYCLYHDDHGHDTEECRHLASSIEGLISTGKLKKYLADNKGQKKGKGKQKKNRKGGCGAGHNKKGSPDDEDDEDAPQFDGVIAAIDGLPPGKTRTAAKKEIRSSNAAEPTSKRLKKEEAITFSDDDPVPAQTPHQDAIVIQAGISNKLVQRVFVDTGASVSVLFKACFDKLEIKAARLTPSALPLRSFAQEETRPEGTISLPVTVGKAPASSTTAVNFFVVDAPSPYNAILGRDWLNAVKAVCSTYHLTVKIPTKNGVIAVRGDQKRAKECMQIALRGVGPPQFSQA